MSRNVLLLSSIQLVLFFALRLVLKRPWLAALVFSVVPFFLGGGVSSPSSLGRSLTAVGALLFAALLLRFGVLASTWVAIIAIVALTAFAFHTARASRPLFRSGLLDVD